MDTRSAVKDSHRRFEIPGLAQIVEGHGGLPKIRITTPACEAEMYLHGAQVTSWRPAGEDEVLFLSSRSRWEDGHAIRGGIPICFPWFAHKADNPHAPDHGLVRTKPWELDSISQVEDGIAVSLTTESDETTKQWWPAEFRTVFRATFGKQLRLALVVANTGETPLVFEEALHAYFRVGNIEVTRARIPDALHYIDKTDFRATKTQFGDILINSETDRVYLNTKDEIELEDPLFHRRVRIAKEHSCTTVVWNPWIEKAQALPDFGADEWTRMICIEPSNVSDFAVRLAPSQQHTMTVLVRVVDF